MNEGSDFMPEKGGAGMLDSLDSHFSCPDRAYGLAYQMLVENLGGVPVCPVCTKLHAVMLEVGN